MKNFNLLLGATALLSTAFAMGVKADNKDTVDIKAEFISPANLIKHVDMDFGKLFMARNSSGTVVLSPQGEATPTGDMEHYGHAQHAIVSIGMATGGKEFSFPSSVQLKNGDTVCATVDTFTVDDVTYTAAQGCGAGPTATCDGKGIGATLRATTTGDDILDAGICTATMTVSLIATE